jgi:hypothetical protein
MGESSKIPWENMNDALPAFLTIILMPLTYSITNGMIFGLLTALIMYFTCGLFFPNSRITSAAGNESGSDLFTVSSRSNRLVNGEIGTEPLLIATDNVRDLITGGSKSLRMVSAETGTEPLLIATNSVRRNRSGEGHYGAV